MGVNPTAETANNKSNPLVSTYAIYKDMYDNNIIYSYKGVVTSDLVTHVLEIMGDTLDDDDKSSKKVSKKVSNVMVECLTNVYADEDKLEGSNGYDPTALLMVKRVGRTYYIVTSTNIPSQSVSYLKKLIDRINFMRPDELKELYIEQLVNTNPGMVGITSLGIIDLARKSRNQLNYHFKYINPEYSFFSLEAKISKIED